MQRSAISIAILFLLLASGCVISPRRGSNNNGGTGTGQLYVTNESGNSILRFSGATAATGNITPTATISGTSTQLSTPKYIFVDPPNNRMFVANSGASDILVFDGVSTLSDNVPPSRTIMSTSLSLPIDLALDSSRDLLYVADNMEVVVFASASTTSGTQVPARVIQPGFTPSAIFLDSASDRLFLADGVSNAVDVFDNASTLNGQVNALRSLSGGMTQLAQPDGLNIDGAGRLIVSNFTPASITIYTNAASVDGNIAPVAILSGGSTTLAGPAQLALDPTTNAGELYVADPFGANIAVFSSISTVTGSINPVPNRNLIGSATTLTGTSSATARGVALDTTR